MYSWNIVIREMDGGMRYKILVVDEKPHLHERFLSVFEKISDIYYAHDVHDVLHQISISCFHLIILVDMQGLEKICKSIKAIRILKKIPILVITSEEEKAQYIKVGADIVITFDYANEEDVKLQVFSLMRRYVEWEKENNEKEEIFQNGFFSISFSRRKVFWKEQEVKITKHEFDFLYLLTSSPERVYTFNQIYRTVWGDYPRGDIVNMIRCMVGRIKKKLKAIDSDIPDVICNVRNIGYVFKMNMDI